MTLPFICSVQGGPKLSGPMPRVQRTASHVRMNAMLGSKTSNESIEAACGVCSIVSAEGTMSAEVRRATCVASDLLDPTEQESASTNESGLNVEDANKAYLPCFSTAAYRWLIWLTCRQSCFVR